MTPVAPAHLPLPETPTTWVRLGLIWLGILGLVYLLLVAVAMIGGGFSWASGGTAGAKAIFAFAVNPIVGLILGIFCTALVQSSSTVTSVIVGLVAGGLPVGIAVPMIMGANIGTTVTNILVSLAHITRPQEFRRAFAAANVHDMFNLLAVLIFLPLEMLTGFLQRSALFLSDLLVGHHGASSEVQLSDFDVVKKATRAVVDLFHNRAGDGLLDGWCTPVVGGILLSVLGLGAIFVSILLLSRLLRSVLKGRAERIFHAAIGRGPITGIFSGTAMTVLVQSSSTTTSLVVPMAGAGMLSLRQVYPFTLGANIGTTITALLASLAVSTHAEEALAIALVHSLFNICAVIVVYGLPFLRPLPIHGAEWLAAMAIRNRAFALLWLIGTFFVIPLLVLGAMKLFEDPDPAEPPAPPTPTAPVHPSAPE